MSKTLEEQMEEAAVQSALNMGEPEHVFHPDYGWIKRNGEWTEVGDVFLKDHYEDLIAKQVNSIAKGIP